MSRLSERIGRSGEFSVCAWLSKYTDLVSLIPHGSHADIVFEYNKILYKCQVKTSTQQKKYKSIHTGREYRSGWCWDLRRGANTKDRDYYDQIDLYALYCSPYNIIVWMPGTEKTKHTIKDQDLKNYDSYNEWIKTCEQLVNSSQKA